MTLPIKKPATAPKRGSRSLAQSRTGGTASRIERIPAGLPRVYADQAMDVVYGLHTTKIVLGEETGAASMRPVATIVMPTATLLLLAKGVVADLSSAGMVKETAERFAEILAAMQHTKVE